MTLAPDVATDLTEALRRAGVGDVDDSGLARALYSSDGSLYRVLPRAVVRPRHPDEIEATLAVCRELGVAFTARGAGTSIAGNAVGPGVVVDVSRHLHRVLEVDPDAGTVTLVCEARTTDRTGVEMEALVACSVGALAVYDMVKGIEPGVVIERVELLDKTGGKADFHR